MPENPHSNHHLALLHQLTQVAEALMQSQALVEPSQLELLERLRQLSQAPGLDEDFYLLGQDTLCRIVAAWPQLTPSVARDLFWFFGGDCLQFMPDDEIASYQQLDEARHEAESTGQAFDWVQRRNQLFGLH